MCNSFLTKINAIAKNNRHNKAIFEIYLSGSKKILCVEGNLDKVIYEFILKRKGISDVFIVSIGSKRNFPVVRDFFKDFKIFGFLDRDNDSKSELNAKYTSCYSIENYFFINQRWKNIIPKEKHNEFLTISNIIYEKKFQKLSILKEFIDKSISISHAQVIYSEEIFCENIKWNIAWLARLFNKDMTFEEVFLKYIDEATIEAIWTDLFFFE